MRGLCFWLLVACLATLLLAAESASAIRRPPAQARWQRTLQKTATISLNVAHAVPSTLVQYHEPHLLAAAVDELDLLRAGMQRLHGRAAQAGRVVPDTPVPRVPVAQSGSYAALMEHWLVSGKPGVMSMLEPHWPAAAGELLQAAMSNATVLRAVCKTTGVCTNTSSVDLNSAQYRALAQAAAGTLPLPAWLAHTYIPRLPAAKKLPPSLLQWPRMLGGNSLWQRAPGGAQCVLMPLRSSVQVRLLDAWSVEDAGGWPGPERQASPWQDDAGQLTPYLSSLRQAAQAAGAVSHALASTAGGTLQSGMRLPWCGICPANVTRLTTARTGQPQCYCLLTRQDMDEAGQPVAELFRPPGFSDCAQHRATVEPGQALVIPAGWAAAWAAASPDDTAHVLKWCWFDAANYHATLAWLRAVTRGRAVPAPEACPDECFMEYTTCECTHAWAAGGAAQQSALTQLEQKPTLAHRAMPDAGLTITMTTDRSAASALATTALALGMPALRGLEPSSDSQSGSPGTRKAKRAKGKLRSFQNEQRWSFLLQRLTVPAPDELVSMPMGAGSVALRWMCPIAQQQNAEHDVSPVAYVAVWSQSGAAQALEPLDLHYLAQMLAQHPLIAASAAEDAAADVSAGAAHTAHIVESLGQHPVHGYAVLQWPDPVHSCSHALQEHAAWQASGSQSVSAVARIQHVRRAWAAHATQLDAARRDASADLCAQLAGLQPDAKYSIRLAAITPAGMSHFSSPTHGSLGAAAALQAPATAAMIAVRGSLGEAKVQWQHALDTELSVRGLDIQLASVAELVQRVAAWEVHVFQGLPPSTPTATAQAAPVATRSAPGTARHAAISGLAPGGKYWARVRARSERGVTSAWRASAAEALPAATAQLATAHLAKARVVQGAGSLPVHGELLDQVAPEPCLGPLVDVVDSTNMVRIWQAMPSSSEPERSMHLQAWASHWSPRAYIARGEAVAVRPPLGTLPGRGGAVTLFNEAQLQGRIAVFRRGGIPLGTKVVAAAKAGAIAVVIIDTDGACSSGGGASYNDRCVPGSSLDQGVGWGVADDVNQWRYGKIPAVILAREEAAALTAVL